MRICTLHWQMMRDAIEVRGMSGLVAKDGETALADQVAELNGEPDPAHKLFDPLMSMHWHWSNIAVEAGGLAMLQPGPESNGGHLCPVCELAAHYDDFVPEPEIAKVADQMLNWARDVGLVPKVS